MSEVQNKTTKYKKLDKQLEKKIGSKKK